ncbi:Adenylate kinase 2- chloroplastic [Striga hermonthica]|uniref:adenylate kinase n=1 Tax=Striga hermonthica TaxID=68872 RepID=A0A9N7N6L9_STRHE|nr:Adenylate kinase 2- chloroplastic [Striga hermonthica]
MAVCGGYSVNFAAASFNPNKPLTPSSNPLQTFSRPSSARKLPFLSLHSSQNSSRTHLAEAKASPSLMVAASGKKPEPLKVMISGAPASGKGTQCELITKKFDLVHVAAGDLLRAEVASGTDNGKLAKEYMEKGQLVPNEIVVMMVKDRLSQQDSQEKGWLLDGYPRSESQAIALKKFGFDPDIFILLEVPEEILVERVVGRRLDPVTGKIYHLKYSPPETEEIAARLTQRFDDTEEKVKLRLLTHNSNVEAVLSMYQDISIKIDGTLPKQDVFSQINSILTELIEKKEAALGSTLTPLPSSRGAPPVTPPSAQLPATGVALTRPLPPHVALEKQLTTFDTSSTAPAACARIFEASKWSLLLIPRSRHVTLGAYVYCVSWKSSPLEAVSLLGPGWWSRGPDKNFGARLLKADGLRNIVLDVSYQRSTERTYPGQRRCCAGSVGWAERGAGADSGSRQRQEQLVGGATAFYGISSLRQRLDTMKRVGRFLLEGCLSELNGKQDGAFSDLVEHG